jgi:hypothetical protein
MRSLWETMLWQWLGRQGMAARGEYADLLGADSVRLTLAFAVRREAAAIGHADWPAPIDQTARESVADFE